MRLRALVAVLFVVASACGDGTTTTAPTTTTTAVPVGRLAYQYRPGDELTYALSVEQEIDMTAQGDATALSEEGFPEDAHLNQAIDALLFYEVAEGPEEGTLAITISTELGQVEMSGTFGGEPFDPATDEADFAAFDSVETTVVIDEQGRVVDAEIGGLDMAAMLGDFSALQDVAGGGLGQHLGPAFPDHELSVGESWTDEHTVEAMDQIITTTASHKVTSLAEIDGHSVLMIESETETGAISMDMGEFLRALFAGFGGAEAEDQASQEELDELLSQLRFVISLDPTTTHSTVWFDPEAGLVRRAEQRADVVMTMDVQIPDETTGELVAFVMEMAVNQLVHIDLEADAPA